MFHHHPPVQPAVENQAERENKVFVGMLPKSLDEKDLYDIFRSFGELKEVVPTVQLKKRILERLSSSFYRFTLFARMA